MRERPGWVLLMSGALAQLMTFAAAPILTRLYTPAQLGVLGAFTAAVSIAVPLCNGRFEFALPSLRGSEAHATLKLCLAWTSLMTLLFAVLAWQVAYGIDNPLIDSVRPYWLAFPAALFLMAVYDILALEASRRNQLLPLAQSRLLQAGVGVGSQIGLALAGFGLGGLLAGFVANQGAGALRLMSRVVWSHPDRSPVSTRALARLAWKLRRYPLFSSWTSCIDGVSRWGVQLAFALMWDPVVAGYIFLADRIIGRPLSLISTSALPVYTAQMGRALNEAPSGLIQLFDRTVIRQGSAALTYAAVAAGAAPLLMEWAFGQAWLPAVPYLQLTALALAPMSCVHAVAHTLQVTGRQRLDAVLVSSKVGCLLVVLATCQVFGSTALVALAAYALTMLAFSAITLVVFRRALIGFVQADGVITSEDPI